MSLCPKFNWPSWVKLLQLFFSVLKSARLSHIIYFTLLTNQFIYYTTYFKSIQEVFTQTDKCFHLKRYSKIFMYFRFSKISWIVLEIWPKYRRTIVLFPSIHSILIFMFFNHSSVNQISKNDFILKGMTWYEI